MKQPRRDFSMSSSSYERNTKKAVIESTFSPTKCNTTRSRSNRSVVPMPLHPCNNVPLPTSSSSLLYQTPRNNQHQKHLEEKPNSASSTASGITNSNIIGIKKAKLLSRKTKNVKIQTQVEFQSILRIRPLSIEENGEKNMFSMPKDDNHTIRLHPLKERPSHLSLMGRRQKDIELIAPSEYHFDAVLNEGRTQEDVYQDVAGDVMAWDVVHPLFTDQGVGGDATTGATGATTTSDMEAKQHVIVSMGVSNAGKTHTIFGDQKKHKDDGIVPRLIDDMFLAGKNLNMDRMDIHCSDDIQKSVLTQKLQQNKHHTNAKKMKFGLQMSMVHLHNDHVYDMLSSLDDNSTSCGPTNNSRKRTSSVSKMIESFETRPLHNTKTKQISNLAAVSSMKELKIRKDRQSQDFTIDPNIITCTSPSHARHVLNEGLKHNTTSSTNLNKCSSRGHTMITIRPVLHYGENENEQGDNHISQNEVAGIGGSIHIIDMAGIERTKTSAVSGMSMRESVSINTTISAMLQCLRSIKHNNNGDNKNDDDNETNSSYPKYDEEYLDDTENISPSIGTHHDYAIQNIKSESKRRSNETNTKHAAQQIVPYRQNKLTMLMQPLFSGYFACASNIKKIKTTVKILVSVYPGTKDYNEKKTLLSEIDSLRGLKTNCMMKQRLNSDSMVSMISDIGNTTTLSTASEQSREISFDTETTSTKDQIKGNYVDDVPQKSSSSSYASPLKRIAKAVTSKTSSNKKKRKAEIHELVERIKYLEEDNNALRKQNNSTITKYTSLQSENKKLKIELEESKVAQEKMRQEMTQMQGTLGGEVSYNNMHIYNLERDARLEEQNLLGSTLRQHMQSVDMNSVVYGGNVNVRGRMTVKPPFQLIVPSTKSKQKNAPIEKEKNEEYVNDEEEEAHSLYSA